MALSTTTFDSHNPVTNDVISTHEIYNETAVVAAVERARNASQAVSYTHLTLPTNREV